MRSAMSRVCDPAGHKFIPVEVDEFDMYTGIQKILTVIKPDWPQENIKFKIFTDGITNKLVACQLDPTNNPDDNENVVLVRIYGNKTDLLIDRNAEVRNITVLNKAGLAPKIYGVFKNGLSYEYYPGITLDTDTVTDAKISRLVAQQMARMHKIQLSEEVPREPMVWDKIEQFLSLIPEKFTDTSKHARFTNSFGSVTRLRIEFERLKSHLIKTESPIVFAHNDLLLGNVIYNESKGTVSFIDYEYASYNYQAFDIANHFNEFVGISIENMDYSRYPNKDFQINWIRIYLAEYLDDPTPSHEQIEEIYKDVQRLSLASHFMWGIWSLVQLELSDIDFDFGRCLFITKTVMGKHFGDLAFIRGIIYYTLSPHEQKPFAGAIKHGIPNFFPRTIATAWTWVPPFVLSIVLYNTIEAKYKKKLRKDPRDYIDEVDPNA